MVHFIDLLRTVAFPGKKVANGYGNRGDQSHKVTEGYTGKYRTDVVRLILLRPVMPQPNFVLIVKPILIVGPTAGIQNPLAEPFPHSRQIAGDWLARFVEECLEQKRLRANKSIPHVKNFFYLILEDVTSQAKPLVIFICEKARLL
jgi:hypothetical protein